MRTFSDWGYPPPGFVEADLVAHSGPTASGAFVQTLVLTDIATGWTECAPLLLREQTLLVGVRPTAQAKPKTKRGSRRPDPLVSVTDELRGWFEADPLRTGGELLRRLQAAYPGDYPDGLLRAVQRRLKLWRTELATSLVLGPPGAPASASMPSGASA